MGYSIEVNKCLVEKTPRFFDRQIVSKGETNSTEKIEIKKYKILLLIINYFPENKLYMENKEHRLHYYT